MTAGSYKILGQMKDKQSFDYILKSIIAEIVNFYTI